MEIADYLRTARRHLVVLAGVPILAATLAVAYLLANPRPYIATVFVSAPSLMGSQYGTYAGPGASQFPSDFVATATSPTLETAVARQTHVGVGDVKNGLSVEQVQLSSRVEVTYTTRNPSTANSVALAVARRTLMSMFASQVTIAETAVKSATVSLHAADRALARFSRKHGSLPVDQQYATLTAQAQAAALAPLDIHHADLLAKQAAAASTLTTSQQVLAQAQAQFTAADPRQVQAAPAQEVALATLVVTTVLPAAAVGVFLAILLVALLELVAQRRRQTVHGRPLVDIRTRWLSSTFDSVRLHGMMAMDGRLRSTFDSVRLRGMMAMDKLRAVGKDSDNISTSGMAPEPISQEAESR